FRVMGIVLIFFAAGLLGSAVGQMQTLGWLSFGTAHLWDLRAVLSDESTVGGLLHGLLGYSDNPTVLQAIAYALYLVVAGGLFWRETRKHAPIAQPASGAPTPASSTAQ
ncbi:MAG TPA: FTR1 family protein, partial [Castellaniella sp.]|nr:FTR1 family protein [Castellaniella sp.]